MELRINLRELEDLELSFTEYLVLWGLHEGVRYGKITIDQSIYDNLLAHGHIMIDEDGKYKLLQSGVEIFEPTRSNFSDFISIFPTRVSSPIGEVRVLSPASSNTVVGKRLLKKWLSITHAKPEIETKIIKCLQEEIDLRRKNGTLHFMRNAETWLNKATWEDYEYLLEQPIKETGTKINEIKL
jgi:hypothetical protein